MEQLQPDWLSSKVWRYLYVIISRVAIGVAFVLVPAALIALPLPYPILTGPLLFFEQPLDMIWAGIIAGTIGGLVDLASFEWWGTADGRRRHRLRLFLNLVIYLLVIPGLAFAACFSFPGQYHPVTFLWLASIGTFNAIVFGFRGAYRDIGRDILWTEALNWSWRRCLKVGAVAVVGFTGFLIWIGHGPMNFVRNLWDNPVFREGVLFLCVFFLPFGLTAVIFAGLKKGILKTKSVPNQGMRDSLRNAAISGCAIAAIIALVSVACFELGIWLVASGHLAKMVRMPTRDAYFPYVASMPFFAAAVGFFYGGFDVLQHFVLRAALRREVRLPMNLVAFLDHCVRLIFLRRMGGGYIFMHRMLLDHFAELGGNKQPRMKR